MKRPLVSIMIPTRGRVSNLIQAMDSCWSLAVDKTLLEFVIKVDDDDRESIDVVRRIAKSFPVKVIESPRGRGYLDLPKWIVSMAEKATGIWLMVFNDDTKILTSGWDQLLALVPVYEDEIMMVIPRIMQRPASNENFFICRRVFEVLQSVGDSPHVDTWLATIMIMLDRAVHLYAVEIDHPGEEDHVADDRNKVVYDSNLELRKTSLIRRKLADTEKLMRYIDKANNSPNGVVGVKIFLDWVQESIRKRLVENPKEFYGSSFSFKGNQ